MLLRLNINQATFGSPISSRSFSASSYKYGFNGKEKDDEVKGSGNSVDYGSRIYDSRLGRFLSVDPLAKNFSFKSTYDYAENDVIRCVDLDGEEKFERTGDGKLLVTIVYGVISDPTSTLLGKDYKPVVNTLNLTQVEAKLKEAYISGSTKIPAKLAKKLGFTGKADSKGLVTVQVVFDVSIKDVGKGEDFKSDSKPENFSIVVKGSVKDPGAPADQQGKNLDITVLNEKVFTEGKTDDELAKAAKDNYNSVGKAQVTNNPSPGKVIAHEGAHKLFGAGEDGHAQGGLLSVEDPDIKTNQNNLDKLFIEQGANIQDQLLKKE